MVEVMNQGGFSMITANGGALFSSTKTAKFVPTALIVMAPVNVGESAGRGRPSSSSSTTTSVRRSRRNKEKKNTTGVVDDDEVAMIIQKGGRTNVLKRRLKKANKKKKKNQATTLNISTEHHDHDDQMSVITTATTLVGESKKKARQRTSRMKSMRLAKLKKDRKRAAADQANDALAVVKATSNENQSSNNSKKGSKKKTEKKKTKQQKQSVNGATPSSALKTSLEQRIRRVEARLMGEGGSNGRNQFGLQNDDGITPTQEQREHLEFRLKWLRAKLLEVNASDGNRKQPSSRSATTRQRKLMRLQHLIAHEDGCDDEEEEEQEVCGLSEMTLSRLPFDECHANNPLHRRRQELHRRVAQVLALTPNPQHNVAKEGARDEENEIMYPANGYTALRELEKQQLIVAEQNARAAFAGTRDDELLLTQIALQQVYVAHFPMDDCSNEYLSVFSKNVDDRTTLRQIALERSRMETGADWIASDMYERLPHPMVWTLEYEVNMFDGVSKKKNANKDLLGGLEPNDVVTEKKMNKKTKKNKNKKKNSVLADATDYGNSLDDEINSLAVMMKDTYVLNTENARSGGLWTAWAQKQQL